VMLVKGMGYDTIRIVVVQVRAWDKANLFLLNGLVVTFNQSGVRPGLIGRMDGLGFSMLKAGPYHGILLGPLCRRPLFQLNDNHLLLLLLV